MVEIKEKDLEGQKKTLQQEVKVLQIAFQQKVGQIRYIDSLLALSKREKKEK